MSIEIKLLIFWNLGPTLLILYQSWQGKAVVGWWADGVSLSSRLKTLATWVEWQREEQSRATGDSETPGDLISSTSPAQTVRQLELERLWINSSSCQGTRYNTAGGRANRQSRADFDLFCDMFFVEEDDWWWSSNNAFNLIVLYFVNIINLVNTTLINISC